MLLWKLYCEPKSAACSSACRADSIGTGTKNMKSSLAIQGDLKRVILWRSWYKEHQEMIMQQ